MCVCVCKNLKGLHHVMKFFSFSNDWKFPYMVYMYDHQMVDTDIAQMKLEAVGTRWHYGPFLSFTF